MGTNSREVTKESKALVVAIKRAMAVKDMRTPGLAKKAEIPYSTLRKIMEGRSVADYEQLRKIAISLNTKASVISADAEQLIEKGEIR
ncbi:MAG: hypothetical protein LKI93_04800 [Bifidobacteriaceae bacterium]|jgi:predicted transcriptional regulator|nr:hypothetical protein [Bifidobacteriaceae bacterium]